MIEINPIDFIENKVTHGADGSIVHKTQKTEKIHEFNFEELDDITLYVRAKVKSLRERAIEKAKKQHGKDYEEEQLKSIIGEMILELSDCPQNVQLLRKERPSVFLYLLSPTYDYKTLIKIKHYMSQQRNGIIDVEECKNKIFVAMDRKVNTKIVERSEKNKLVNALLSSGEENKSQLNFQ